MKYYIDEDWDDKGNQIGERYDVHDCPFCGSKDTDLYQVQVQCNRCDAHGPAVSDDIWPMAITLWNELPRKQGEELEKLRAHWSNLYRRIKRAEKKARAASEKYMREQNAPIERQSREDKKWAQERAAWLAKPIEGNS